MTHASILLLGIGVALASGCAKPAYVIEPTHHETLSRRLDAEWFTRKVYDGSGLAAVELTYCPIQPNMTTVCRTAVVWQRDASLLMQLEPTSVAPSGSPPASQMPPPPPAAQPPPMPPPPASPPLQ